MKRRSSKSPPHNKPKDKKFYSQSSSSKESESIEQEAPLSSHSSEQAQSSRNLQSVIFKEGKGTGNQLYACLYTPKNEGAKIHLFISGEAFAKEVAQDTTVRLCNKSVVTIESVLNVTDVPTAGTEKNKSIISLLTSAHILHRIISQAEKENKADVSVLVHCKEGYERSVSSVLFYLMGYQGYGFEEGVDMLTESLKQGRGVLKKATYTQSPTSKSSHHQSIANIFQTVQSGEMISRMKAAVNLVNFYLIQSKCETLSKRFSAQPNQSE